LLDQGVFIRPSIGIEVYGCGDAVFLCKPLPPRARPLQLPALPERTCPPARGATACGVVSPGESGYGGDGPRVVNGELKFTKKILWNPELS
jgi:hypothetical protein